MGTWGTGISSNDTYADVYDEFIELYNEGLTPSEITAKLIKENQETIDIPEAANDFWFAIACSQWECKELDKAIMSKIEQIVHSGSDIKVWEELGATKSDLKKREKVLFKFLNKIKTERANPRKRTKKKLYNSRFSKGDCIIYKMENRNYGGSFILADERNTTTGSNYVAITTIDKPEKPTLKDFKKAEILVQRSKEFHFNTKNNETGKPKEIWIEQEQVGWVMATTGKKEACSFEVIGQLPISKVYTTANDLKLGFGWTIFFTLLPGLKGDNKMKGLSKKKVRLKKWRKKSWL